MALLKVICWVLIFITRIRFAPGKSLATKLCQSIKQPRYVVYHTTLKKATLYCLSAASLISGFILFQ